MQDFRDWMKGLLFRNPWLYGLITGGLFAALSFAVSATKGIDLAKFISAVVQGIVFGILMTLLMRRISTPPP